MELSDISIKRLDIKGILHSESYDTLRSNLSQRFVGSIVNPSPRDCSTCRKSPVTASEDATLKKKSQSILGCIIHRCAHHEILIKGVISAVLCLIKYSVANLVPWPLPGFTIIVVALCMHEIALDSLIEMA